MVYEAWILCLGQDNCYAFGPSRLYYQAIFLRVLLIPNSWVLRVNCLVLDVLLMLMVDVLILRFLLPAGNEMKKIAPLAVVQPFCFSF